VAREAGLPPVYQDTLGEQFLLTGSKGVVRAVYPELNRVDIETEDGSLLTQVLVCGPYFPEVHTDGEAPSHVAYMHARGQAEAFCWPMPHRRLLGPRDTLKGEAGQDQPERRYFHTHGYILRFGKVTVRLTRDDRYVIETEEDDYIVIDTEKREIELHAPTVFIGTDDATRIEYQQDQHVRILMPKILMGDQALMDTDGITYVKDDLIHIVSALIKLTADEIVLDPTSIKLGHENATERVMLGDLFKAFLNTFLSLYIGHQHANVQTGPSISGPPTVGTPLMDDSMLSDVTRVSKTGL
jgi:hypothetical protein